MTNLEKHLNGKLVGKYIVTLTYLNEYRVKTIGSFATDNFLEFLKVVSYVFNDETVVLAQTYQKRKRVCFSKIKEAFFDINRDSFFLPHIVLRKFEERRN